MPEPRNGLQDSIYRQLRQLSPALADLYEGARQMLADDDAAPPGWAHFVPHAVREISARVPDLIRGSADDRLDYAARMDRITQTWRRHGLPTESIEVPLTGPTDQLAASADLPVEVVGDVTRLIHDHIRSRMGTFVSKLEEAARLRARDADRAWLARWAREWQRSHGWAQAHAHVGQRSTEPSLADYRSEFSRFERTLAGILGEYVTNRNGLDVLLSEANAEPWEKPADTKVSEVLRLTARLEEQRYFFERLRNPHWIEGLSDAGALVPPEPIPTESGVRYPPWPISSYIARVASTHPDHAFVAGQLRQLIETENVSSQRDLLQAMATLTPMVLQDLLEPVARWLSDPWRLSWIADRLNDVLVNAARHHENSEGVRAILNALFEPFWRTPDEILGERASSLMSEWDAQQFATQVIRQLTEIDPLLLAPTLVEKLGEVLHRQRSDASVALGLNDDHSVIWYPNLGVPNHVHDAEDVLTYLLVCSLDELAQLSAEQSQGVVDLLVGGGWIIHERLAQRFLAATTETQGVSEDALRRLRSADSAAAYQTRREFDDLLARTFRNVDLPERAEILAALHAAAAQQGDRADRWLYARLSRIDADLPDDLRAEFETWRERFGEVVPTDFITVARWGGAQSPLDEGAAAAMAAHDLAAYARAWTPSDDGMLFERPSWEGLSAEVRAEAARRPAEFSAAAGEFSDTDPTVVNGLLKGLTSAVEADENIEWEPVLALIGDIASRSEELRADRVARLEGDPSWAWAKMQAVEFLEAALSREPGPPLAQGPALWEAMLALAAGCEPPDDIGSRDPTTVSVNAARSRVIYAVIAYLFWLRRHGIEGIPDGVAEFLTQTLDPEQEPFVGMRVAIGHRLPQLTYIDSAWTIAALPALFPANGNGREHWTAAWNSYLLYATPLPASPVLEALEPYYQRAVAEIDPDHQVQDTYGDPVVRLGEHVTFMVLGGVWPIDHEVVASYFERAHLTARVRVMDWVGRGVKQDAPSDDWCERARAFFEWREQALAESGADNAELRVIGWFVAVEQFPAEWWLPRLPVILRATADARRIYLPVEEMMQRVAAASAEHADIALEVLELVVEQSEWGRHEPYLLSAEVILDVAIQQADIEHRARQVADRLVRAGHDQFGRFSEYE